MKFPYGICDFEKLIQNGYFYVDRTHKMPLIEDTGEYLLFLRPRRFGKSLVLSMLENYYDVAKAEQFEALFGHLAIGQNPTQKHNQYFVMNWDFSAVDSTGSAEDVRLRLHNHINGCIKQFKARYKGFLADDIELCPTDAIYSLQSVLAAIEGTPYKLYLLIDEYDNFANEVMMAGQSTSLARYETLIQGEGALKAVFKAVKMATKGLGIDRIFITGVYPVAMSDTSSGFNIAKNISLNPKFNDLCGFLEAEMLAALQQIAQECGFEDSQIQEALAVMRVFYNGYRFVYEEESKLYNSTLALYFLTSFQKKCQYPRLMLDNNMAMDRGKLTYISRLLNGEAVIFQALNEKPPLSLKQLADRFGVNDMLNATHDTTFIVSLLYYLGILTLNGETFLGKLRFKIPNLVVRKLYVERLFEMLLPIETERSKARYLAEDFYQTGDLQPVCDFMEQRYFKVFDNRDYGWANELTIKTAFLTVLFDDVFYIMDSETELERRYADLTMIVRPERRHSPLKNFFLEFKYLKLSEVGKNGEQVRQLTIEELKALPPVKQKLDDSKKQLLDYQTRLTEKYGDALPLQLISVVTVGFERVVWQKV